MSRVDHTIQQPQAQPTPNRLLEYSTRAAVYAGVVAFLLGFAATSDMDMVNILAERETGETSLTGMLMTVGLIFGLVIAFLSYRLDQPDEVLIPTGEVIRIRGRSNVVARLATSLAVGLILMTLTGVVMFAVDAVFPGLSLGRYVIVGIVVAYAVIMGFVIAYWTARLNTFNMLALAGVMTTVGIVLAALAVGDPYWWQRSLSYLGSTETAGIYFNVAIIVTGLIVFAVDRETITILTGLAENDLVSRDYLRWSRIHLTAIPICIIGVGLFPTRINPLSDLLHNLSSHLMVVFFVVMMLSTVNRRDSFHSRTFREVSRVFALSIIGLALLEMLSVLNFVAFELIIFVPIGIWLAMYQGQARVYAQAGKAPEVERLRAVTPVAVYALRAGFVAAGVGLVLSLFAVDDLGEMVPFTTPGEAISIANLWLILSFVIGVGVAAVTFRRFILEKPNLSEAEIEALQGRGFWLGRLVVALAAGAFSVTFTAISVLVTDALFPNIAINWVIAIAMTAILAGLLGFVVAFLASGLGSNVNLLILASLTMVWGVAMGGLFIDDPDWWRVSLSYLGSMDNPARIFFNLGTILTGMIVLIGNQDTIALIRILRDKRDVSEDYLMSVRWLLILIPIFVAGVGLFPRRVSPLFDLIHNLSAMAAGGLWMVLAFYTIGQKTTIHSPRFVRVSRWLVYALVGLYVLYIVEILNYVGFELILFVPIAIWLFQYQAEIRSFARAGQSPADTASAAPAG